MPYMLPLPSMQQAPPPPPDQSGKPAQQHHHRHPQLMRTVSISILVMSLPVLYVSFLHVPPAALFRDTTFWFLMSNSIIIVIAADSGMLFFGPSSSSSSCSSSSVIDVKDDHVVSVADGVVTIVPSPVENQVTVLREQQEGAGTMVPECDDHAYALVLRDEQVHRVACCSEPAESRDIMVVTPPSSDLLANRTGGGPIQLSASKSLAREERLRRRRRHHRGPSSPSQYSRALVPVVQDKSVVVVAAAEEKAQQLRRAATTTEEKEKESEYSRLSDEELNRRVEEFITKFNREMRLQLEREQLAIAAA